MVHICYFDLSFISDFGAVFFHSKRKKKLISTAPKIIPTEIPKATFNQFWPFNDFTYYHIWRGLTDCISGLYVKHLVFSFSWNADVRYLNFQLCWSFVFSLFAHSKRLICFFHSQFLLIEYNSHTLDHHQNKNNIKETLHDIIVTRR